ncbi:MAG: enoyl-CoA hydratase/isomerase family protein [Chloroflexi bacterium]|nr:enoyl-CoA hydratase/isomerase family protein [Chloroflexota bacterium]
MADYGTYRFLKIEVEDRVATVTMNRPERRNAFPPSTRHELDIVWTEVGQDQDINSIVFTGAGDHFSVGADLRGEPEAPQSEARRDRAAGGTSNLLGHSRDLIHNILNVPQPIIAAVNGDCIGQAATMALLCDVVYASERARFADTHTKIGLVAGDGGAIIWPYLVGMHRAKEALMTSRIIGAQEAERIGLVNKVLPKEQLLPQALELAHQLADGPQWAIRWTKFVLNKHLWESMERTLDLSLALESITAISEDNKEAVQAFLEKRPPKFTGG